MDNTCDFELATGAPCGLQVAGSRNKCRFHGLEHSGVGAFSTIFEYCTAAKDRDFVDLSRMPYRRISFDKHEWERTPGTYDRAFFNYATFEECVFDGILFLNSVHFNNCSFINCRFHNISFMGEEISFDGARFTGSDCRFSLCTFTSSKSVSFEASVFALDTMPFDSCYIGSKRISFKDALLQGLRFYLQSTNDTIHIYDHRYLTVHAEFLSMQGVKIDGHFEFTSQCDQTLDAVDADFSLVNFEQMKSALFVNADLRKAHFTWANLQGLALITPIWPDGGDGRRILFDELQADENTKTDELRRQYSQLKRISNESQDYVRADQWYYRETECRRRMLKEYTENSQKSDIRSYTALQIVYGRFLFWSYRKLSDYGEDYLKPLLWLLLLWVASATFYMFLGFSVGDHVVNYDLCFSCGFPYDALSSFLLALVFSLAAAALQIGRGFTLETTGASIVYICQIVLTALVLSLLLFAVRRRFKR